MYWTLARTVLRPVRRIPILISLAAAISHAGAADVRPLGFEEALTLAEQRSARLAAQSAAVQAADEQAKRATELPDPKLRFGIDNVPVSGPDAYSLTRDSMTMKRLAVMQDLPNGDKRRARGARAEHERQVESADLEAQRAVLRQEVAVAWLELYYARRSRETLAELAEHYRVEAEIAPASVSAGRTPAAGVLAVRSALESARDRQLDQERMVMRAQSSLAALVGDAAGRPLGSPPDPSRLAYSRQELLGNLNSHPALRMHQERVELAQAEVALATSSTKPDWSIEVGYGQRSPNFSNMVTVMVGVDLPLDKPNRQNRDIASKVNQRERARWQWEEARRMHEGEVGALLADWEIAGQRIQRFETATLPLARDRVELALAAYRGGRGELGAVLEARRAQTEAQLSFLAVSLERARAWAKLNHLFPHEVRR